ncbi:MAG: ABC transporter six-transmembrane domain-containing protein [Pseudomonadota bacterium]
MPDTGQAQAPPGPKTSPQHQHLGLGQILRRFRGRIAVTWALVILENAAIALIPLQLGLAIDGVLGGSGLALAGLFGLLALLAALSVGRRIYDTRAYSAIRVHLGGALNRQRRSLPVGTRTVRIDLARELVDFLEHALPEFFTAAIQLLVALVVFWVFDWRLLAAALIMTAVVGGFYSLFHRRFFRLNAALNAQKERQVDTLALGLPSRLVGHLRALRRVEIRLSDTEAVLYGSVFVLQSGFLVFATWFAARILDASAGEIFAIVTYAWAFVEASFSLPAALQDLTRLGEITARINSGHATVQEAVAPGKDGA